MPNKQEVTTYYDKFLDHLKGDHQRENPRHIKIKQDLKQIVKEGFDVLDIGCGTGITTKYIAELGAKVIGMDISPKLIQYAKKNSAHKNARYKVQDITALSSKMEYDSETFDVISLIDIMEHIPREKMLCLLRVINFSSHKNTVVYLNIPDARFQEYLRGEHAGRLQIVDEGYATAEVLEWLKTIDFEAIKIEIYGLDLPAQYRSFIFVRKERVLANYKEYFEGKTA